MEVTRAKAIAEVSTGDWDKLAGGYPLYGRRWYRVQEMLAAAPARWRYLVARRAGEAVGMAAGREESWIDQLVYGKAAGVARAVGLGVGAAVRYGVVTGVGEAIVLAPGLGERERAEARRALIDGMIEDAAGAAVMVRGVRRWERELREALEERGFLATRDVATTYLPLPEGDFGAYRRWLRQNHATTEKNIGRELSLGRRSGLTIGEIPDWEGEREAIAALYTAHWERWNGPLTHRRDNLTLLREGLGEHGVLRGAWVDGVLTGVQVVARAGEVEMALAIAVDEERGKKSAAYFNLGYNSVIAGAMAAGRRGIYFGRLLYEAKARRGCVAVPMEMYIRPGRRRLGPVWRAAFPTRNRLVVKQWAGMPEGCGEI